MMQYNCRFRQFYWTPSAVNQSGGSETHACVPQSLDPKVPKNFLTHGQTDRGQMDKWENDLDVAQLEV